MQIWEHKMDTIENKEVRYVDSQKYGWVAITEGDRDWDFGVTEKIMVEQMVFQRRNKMREIHSADYKRTKLERVKNYLTSSWY